MYIGLLCNMFNKASVITSFVYGSAHPIFLTCVIYFSQKCMPDHEGFRIDKQEGHRP